MEHNLSIILVKSQSKITDSETITLHRLHMR